DALDRADDLVAEGRERVSGLRGAEAVSGTLEDALVSIATERANGTGTAFRSTTQGTTRPLNPIAREELFRIGSEAIFNAFNHAAATRIEMEIVYDDSYLLLKVRDNGRGFDVDTWKAGARTGHFGLIGIQERAERLDTSADIASRPGAGTEISIR